MRLGIIIYIVGLEWILINKERNFINLIMLIEILYLGVLVLTISLSINLDDIIGLLYGLYLILITGLESSIGLGILIGFYRIRGSIEIKNKKW